MGALAQRRASVTKELEAAELRWIEASERIEVQPPEARVPFGIEAGGTGSVQQAGPPRHSIHMLPAIDAQGRSGHEARVFAAQERHASCDLLRLPYNARPGSWRRSFPARLRHRAHHVVSM
jgi:hypothetical protein